MGRVVGQMRTVVSAVDGDEGSGRMGMVVNGMGTLVGLGRQDMLSVRAGGTKL